MGQDDLKPEGIGRYGRAGGEAHDDVEGHRKKVSAVEPEGRKPAATDDDDVEGHRSRQAYAVEPDGRKPAASDDDVEGHVRQG